MARHKHPDTSEPHLPGEAEIARIYAAGGQDEPPVALDQKILAAAQQSVQPPRRRTHFGARWADTFAIVVCASLLVRGIP